ncbi:GYD domain-containing protein [Kistimonas asteriae]|uniref:GYD domain-containing protein n=1 Tax=Kistimonas asteriae TaxID=517724 RepID=UPI001BA5758B|nr:GYD domain-containing protein [Kistimonas asteriae]
MPKYLIQANYVGEGVKGLLKDGGSKRKAAVENLIESLSGKIESFYYSFGATDLFVIGEFPDNTSLTAAVLSVNATGMCESKTTVLLSPEELDEAAKKSPVYIAPGQ